MFDGIIGRSALYSAVVCPAIWSPGLTWQAHSSSLLRSSAMAAVHWVALATISLIYGSIYIYIHVEEVGLLVVSFK